MNRVDVTDLKNFFLRWYGPNNATITIGGDVKTADVVKLVEKYFGSIQKGPDVVPPKKKVFEIGYIYAIQVFYIAYCKPGIGMAIWVEVFVDIFKSLPVGDIVIIFATLVFNC